MPRCYAALPDRVLAVANDWRSMESFTGVSPSGVAIDPADAERALCGAADGLYETTDGGVTWTATPRFAGVSVTAVAVGADGTAWAGTEPSHVYRRRETEEWEECREFTALDSSASWSFPPRPDTHHVRWLEPAADDPDRVYAAVEAGALVHTSDGGETWTDRAPDGPRDTHQLATHANAPGRLYAAAGDGYAESTDGNQSWTWLEDGLDRTYCWSVAVDPDDPDHRVLTAATGPRTAHRTGGAAVFVRGTCSDAGGAWERATGLPAEADLLAPVVEPLGAGAFLAVTNHGLFRSTEGGASWSEAPIPWPAGVDGRPSGLAVAHSA